MKRKCWISIHCLDASVKFHDIQPINGSGCIILGLYLVFRLSSLFDCFNKYIFDSIVSIRWIAGTMINWAHTFFGDVAFSLVFSCKNWSRRSKPVQCNERQAAGDISPTYERFPEKWHLCPKDHKFWLYLLNILLNIPIHFQISFSNHSIPAVSEPQPYSTRTSRQSFSRRSFLRTIRIHCWVHRQRYKPFTAPFAKYIHLVYHSASSHPGLHPENLI